MNYLTDPDFDENMAGVTNFLLEQQDKLLALIDDGPDEFDPSAIFDIPMSKNDI